MTNERVLVTGAAGQVGRAVLELLSRRGVPVTALVLEPGDDLAADRLVTGDACDPETVARALDGATAVIHLAALPSPDHGTPAQVFTTNTRATFVVLEEAGRQGVRHASIAGSYAVGGLPFSPHPVTPPYLPVDVDTPLRIGDPYALSKQVDEATAAMMATRHGMSVTCLRLPYIGGHLDRLPTLAAQYAARPQSGANDVWSYIDTRDAARAMTQGLEAAEPGAHVCYVAAPTTLSPLPTEELLDRFLPDVPRRRRFEGREVPIDLEPARKLLGFEAEHLFEG
ncbi:NAD-dependent epimerase/dehydratase family protein [Nonomuraea sp. NPDC050663]|uniref:NAD-dependent epimerase/dehydratase family protein n=1 Tax=Nonomuraea sp. NPDC050663 TaxID=3364370 RepID=UPI00379191B3